jgi:hypothetical protein
MLVMAKLNSTSSVIEALGGRVAVASLFGVGPTAVDHWENGKFPAHTYIGMISELYKRGHDAPADLWKFKSVLPSSRRKVKSNETAA